MTLSVAAVSAFSNSVSYALATGSLPAGLSLSSTGAIFGTAATAASGLYSFGLTAADAYGTVGRAFTMTATARTVTWTTAAALGTYVQQTALSIPLVAVSSLGNSVGYALSGSYPAGLTITGTAITGLLPAIGSNTAYSFSVTASDGIVSNVQTMSLTAALSSASDALASNVVCLLHFDNNFADAMGHTVYAAGIPTIVGNASALYNQSLALNGASSLNVSAPDGQLDFGSNDFTIEISFYATAFFAGFTPLLSKKPSGIFWGLFYQSGVFSWYINNVQTLNWSYTPSLNTWYNLALSKVSGVYYLFINGGLVSSQANATAIPAAPLTALGIGGDSDAAALATIRHFTGYLDEIRITTGTGRYTANYTVSLPYANPPVVSSPVANAIAIIGGGPFALNASTSYTAQTLSYSLVSGTLPAGLTLNSATGVSGSTSNPGATTNYTFVMTATDGFSPVTRSFNAAVLHGIAPVWVTPSGSLGTQVQTTNVFAQLNAVANAVTLSTSAATTVAGNLLTFAATTGVLLGMTISGPGMPANTVVSAANATTVTPSNIIPPIPLATGLNFTPTPVTYAISSGTLPAGLALNATTGVIAGLLGAVSTNTTTNFSVTASTVPALNTARSFAMTTLPIATTDPFMANVVFESRFDGGSGGSLFYDYLGHTVSALAGAPSLSTATAIAGSSSLFVNGASYLQYPPSGSEFTFGSGDFTIEVSIFMPVAPTAPANIVGCWVGSTESFVLYVSDLSHFFLGYSSTGNTSASLTWTVSFSLNTWYRIAVARVGSTVYGFVNGTLVASTAFSTVLYSAIASPLSIGGTPGTTSFFTGFIDEVRLTKGVGRYTASYTPADDALPPILFTTPSGSLGTQVQGANFAVYVVAQSPFQAPVTYFLASGALPTGLTLNPATGYISGVLPVVTSDTVSNFVLGASDGSGTTLQGFSITTANAVINDPVAALVVAELHFDGVHGASNFIDVKGHPLQLGQSGISTATITNAIRLMGSGALSLSGSVATDGVWLGNASVTYPEYALGTLDFTIEMSVYFAVVPAVANAPLIAQGNGFGVVYNVGKLYFFTTISTNAVTGFANFTWTPSVNTWYRLAFVRSNGSFTIYVNGTALGAGQALAALTAASGQPLILGWQSSGTAALNAVIDEVRITAGAIGSGAARYTSNYTPQVQPFGNPYAPVFVNPLASLGTQLQGTAFNAAVFAQEGGTGRTISYAVTAGTLPAGLALSASTGVISGTLPAVVADTTSAFSITAADTTALSSTLATAITVAATNVVAFGSNGVVAQMRFDNATTDLKSHVATLIGNPAFSTTTFTTGTGSLYLPGLSALSYAPTGTEFQFGAGDFTVEASVYLTATPAGSGVVGASTAASQGFLLYLPNLTAFGFSYATAATTSTTVTWAFTFALNTWYRLNVVRFGTSLYGYVNGTYISANNIAGTAIFASTAPLFVGFNQAGSVYFQGFVDELRVTKGFARYGAANYSVTAQPFDDPNTPYFVANGSLLTQVQGSAVDVFIPALTGTTRSIASYAISNGTLAAGLTMNTVSGEITGTLTAVTVDTTGSFTVAVVDNTAASVYQSYTITNSLASPVGPFSNTVAFLVHGNGAANSTVFVDVVRNLTASRTGNPVVTTLYRQYGLGAIALPFGAYLAFNNGASMVFGASDFTLEFSVFYLTQAINTTTYYFIGNYSVGGNTWAVGYGSGTTLTLFTNAGNVGVAWQPAPAKWYQIAVVRRGSVVYFLVNGVLQGGTQAYSGTITTSGTSTTIGDPANFNGLIDEVRVSIGAGLYSVAGYTPATQPFPDPTGPIITSNAPLAGYSGASVGNLALPVYYANVATTTISLASGTLPAGLTLSNTGVLTGTLATVANTVAAGTFTVQALDSRVPNSTAYGSFTLYDRYDAFAANVVSLLHCDGTANTAVFVEGTGHSTNVVSTPVITQYTACGSGAASFAAAGAIQIAQNAGEYAIAGNDFCIEATMAFNTVPGNTVYWLLISSATYGVALIGTPSSTCALVFYYSINGGTSFTQVPVTWTPSLGVFYTVAVARSGSSLRYFINGVQQGTTQTLSATISPPAGALVLGQGLTIAALGTLAIVNGSIDEVRLTNGNARYTGNYTALAGLPFPDVAGTVLVRNGNAVAFGYAGNSINSAVSVSNTAAMTYTVTSGALPAGMALGTSGLITGTYASVSNATITTFAVGAADGVHFSANATLSVVNLFDPVVSNTVVAMHFEGANASTVFTEVKAHSTSVYAGSPVISTAQSYAGSGSLLLDGASAVQIIPNSTEMLFGTGDYTLEAAVFLTVAPANQTLFSQWASSNQQWMVRLNTGSMVLFTSASGLTILNTLTFTYAAGFSVNQWYTIAFSKVGSTVYGFVNGVLVNSLAVSATGLFNGITPLLIGADAAGGNFFPGGYIDEVRITRGSGRYVTSYTALPPGAPFPDLPALAFTRAAFGGNANVAVTLPQVVSPANATGYTYSISTGTLPSGLAINATSGVISGSMPAANATTLLSTVTVTAADGTHLQPITQSVTIYSLADTAQANVTTVLHFEGANASTVFTEVKGHSTSVYAGSPVISNAQSYAGSSSLFLNGSSAIQIIPVSAEANFSNGDFTVEISFLQTSLASNQTLIGDWLTNNQQWMVRLSPGSVSFFTSVTGVNAPASLFTFASSLLINQWYSLAFSRVGSVLYGFLNGTLINAGLALTTTLFNPPVASPIVIGCDNGGNFVPGCYVDEVRITKGLGRYSANYTAAPNGVPFPDMPAAYFIANAIGGNANTAVALTMPTILANASLTSFNLSAGTLPAGLTLNANGVVSGTMPVVALTTVTNVTIAAYDAAHYLPVTQAIAIYDLFDTAAANVVAQMHCEGSNGSTTFTDTKGHSTAIASGSPAISTTTSYAGTGSLLMGTSGSVSITPTGTEFRFGANDYTVEAAIFLTATPTAATILAVWPSVGQEQWNLRIVSATTLGFTTSTTGSATANSLVFTYAAGFLLNQWYAIAVSKVGANLFAFVNGTVLGASQAVSSPLFASTGSLVIGATAGSNFFPGLIDEIRVTNGTGRYNASYTALPNNVPFPG